MSKALRLATIAGLVTQLVEARRGPRTLKGRMRRMSSLQRFTKPRQITTTEKRKKRKQARIDRARTFNWPRKGV